jgi:glycosyltransferase involved in cell wall biosynthesis
MKILVIIPCYNEEANIDFVVSRLDKLDCKLDYIIINDCSKDKTEYICRNRGYNYVSLPVNLGIGGCVQTGYKYALENGYDIAIQHDGDGQHDPGCFETIISPIMSGQADVVIGSRFLGNEGFMSTGLRRLGISFLSMLIYLCSGIMVRDVTSGYRAVNRKYIEFFALRYAQDYPEPESIMDAALNNAKVMEVPVIMNERKEGKSSINSFRPLYYMVKVSLAIILHRLVVRKKA